MGKQSSELRDKISEYFMDQYDELIRAQENEAT